MFMRIIERIRRVFVIFPCFSDLQAVFTDLCNSLFCLLLTFFVTKVVFRAYIYMPLNCSKTPLYF